MKKIHKEALTLSAIAGFAFFITPTDIYAETITPEHEERVIDPVDGSELMHGIIVLAIVVCAVAISQFLNKKA